MTVFDLIVLCLIVFILGAVGGLIFAELMWRVHSFIRYLVGIIK